jgi:hypothetical protein
VIFALQLLEPFEFLPHAVKKRGTSANK